MRKLIYPALFIIITVVGFFWYIQPTYADINDLQDEIGQYDTALSQVSQLQTQLNDKLQQRDAVTSQQLDRLDRIVPSTIDTVRFLIELDRIAAQHGMSVQDVSFSGAPQQFGGSGSGSASGAAESGGDQEGIDLNTLEASFSVAGSYTDIQNLLRDLEAASRLMDVVSFSLSTPEGSEESDSGLDNENNTYEIRIQTYWSNQTDL